MRTEKAKNISRPLAAPPQAHTCCRITHRRQLVSEGCTAKANEMGALWSINSVKCRKFLDFP